MLYHNQKKGSWQSIVSTFVILAVFAIILFAFYRPNNGSLDKIKDSSSELIDTNIENIGKELDNLGDDGLNTASPEDVAVWFNGLKNRLNLYKDDTMCYFLAPVFSGSSHFGVEKSDTSYSTVTFTKSTQEDRSTIVTSSQSYGSIDYTRFVLPLYVTVLTKRNGGLFDLEELAGNPDFEFESVDCPECDSLYFKTPMRLAFGDKQYDAEHNNPFVGLYTTELDDTLYYVIIKPHPDYYVFVENANRYFNAVIREIIDDNTLIKKC